MNQSITLDNIIKPKPNENITLPIIIIALKGNTLSSLPSPNKCNKKPDIANTHKAKMYPKLS